MSAIDKPFNGNLAVTPSMPEIGSWDATCCPPLLCAHSRWHHHLLAGRVTDMMALHAFPLAPTSGNIKLAQCHAQGPCFWFSHRILSDPLFRHCWPAIPLYNLL